MSLFPNHQREVDDLVAQVRAEAAPARASIFRPPPPPLEPSPDLTEHRLAEELQTIQRRLDQLGGILAREPLLLHRYGTQLQSIDLMTQQLTHLAAVVNKADKQAAAERITLTDLRNRLTRRPIRAILQG